MDVSRLIRDPLKVHACLREMADGSIVTSKTMKIYIPARFAERGLAEIRDEVTICGICAYVVDDQYYAVSLTNAMMRLKPSAVNSVKINEDDYYEFVFDAGATVVANYDLVKTDTLVYRIFDEFFTKGRVPWYVKYSEYGKLFDTAKLHANANIGGNPEILELLVATVSRDRSDRTINYRQTVQSYEELETRPPAFIPLRSIQYAATNTTAKLAGSYFRTGTISSLNTKSVRTERIEAILRK